MILKDFWASLQASSLGDYIASSTSSFPMLESIHVIAIVTVFGMLTVMDLRLLGLASRSSPVTIVSHDTLRITWGAFAVAAITGTLLFISKATSYTINPYFQWKMGLIVLAGLNMVFFHLTTWRSLPSWDTKPAIPTAAKIAGGLSLALWVLVIFCGRTLGFTLGVYV